MPGPTRDSVMRTLALATVGGRLGIFVGTGFSMAVTGGTAPSFRGLIDQVIRRHDLGVDLDADARFRHKSYPQIASSLLDVLAEKTGEGRDKANSRYRETIAAICNLRADDALQGRYAPVLKRIRPSWIITTNYDLLLEAMFENAETLLPDRPLMPNRERVPILHLHGHRYRPDSIRITEEDYVSLVGPLDYQRLRLPLLLLESTTLMVGYSLGDINVRAAMEWARSFHGSGAVRLEFGQGQVVQALFTRDAPREPFIGPTGETVVEIQDIAAFLEELAAASEAIQANDIDMRQKIAEFLARPDVAVALANPASHERRIFLALMARLHEFPLPNEVVKLLERSFDPIWTKAREDGGFEYYDVFIDLVIDALKCVDPATCHPAVLGYLARMLDQVAWYIDSAKPRATAHAATDTWYRRKGELGPNLLADLESFGVANDMYGLKKLFGRQFDYRGW